MTHIDRLLNSSRQPRTRELLDAGLNDAPPRGSLARVAAGLGVAASGSAWSAVAAGAGTAASASAASGSTLTVLAAGKLLAIGALAGTLVSGASVALKHAATPAAPRAPTAHAVTIPAPEAARPIEPRAPLEPAPLPVETTEAAPVTTGASEASRPSARTTPDDSGALAAEVARIDAARSALASGDTERALSELAAYQRERRLGVLDREAALLAIRAHSQRGDAERARELSRRYLSAHPDDAHAPRLRELLNEK